ncbi:MAG: methyltransferase domain-containing protein [Chloroflexota bacterium]
MRGLPERFCCDEDLERLGHDGLGWRRDLERLRRDGPRTHTRELIDALRAEGVEGTTVREIGAGVGAVHLALLEAGAAQAVDVDASQEYLAAAREESERRGLAGRVEYQYGDVVELAAELPAADIVAADAVVCCYPYLDRFLRAAAWLAPKLLGLTLPPDTWWSRALQRADNVRLLLLRRPDRWYPHRHRDIDDIMDGLGYESIHRGGPWYWRVLVYRRTIPAV